MKNTKKRLLFAILALTLIFAFVSCGSETNLWENATYTEDTVIGEGAKEFTFTVEVKENSVTFTVNTNKETVGQALLELNIIDGDDGAYGLYVKKVNGITADYDADGSYWSFYINDDYATSGVDMTPITEGETYKLVYAK